jgi:ParB family chromosome partitioning protein
MKHTKADPRKLAYVGSIKRDSDSWYTPKRYIESARKVLGGFSLDPFSNAHSNTIVKARRFFDEKSNAFASSWGKPKTVWMNPPYGSPLCTKSIALFLSEHEKTNFEAIVLVNNATETKWFQAMLSQANAVCFTNHRIAFDNIDGKHISGNTRGQAFFYFGKESGKFFAEFSQYGYCLNTKA